ncbi:MAG: alpha-glucosidase, partial [Myxococcales bacterium]|nr:alpha-glucosidase [Myxococcales bacterium]
MTRAIRWTLLSLSLAFALGLGGEWGLRAPKTVETHDVGAFRVTVDANPGTMRLRVEHADEPGRAIFETTPGESFVLAAKGEAEIAEQRGSFTITDTIAQRCTVQSIESVTESPGGLAVAGRIGGAGCAMCDIGYSLLFEAAADHRLRFTLATDDPETNRVFLRYASDPDERVFGFGEQFTHVDVKGYRFPVIVQEQGIGRGQKPITDLVNLFAPGSGGGPFTTYFVAPQYVTTRNRGLFLENHEVSDFNFWDPDAIEIKLYGTEMVGQILHGASIPALIEAYTEYAGRMAPLPPWMDQGAVVGMQGGTDFVRAKYAALKALDTPIAAFWLQDWVGQRTTIIGRQLWWNWELDPARYPDWDPLVADLAADGVRMLTYINPFLVDVSERGDFDRNLYAEALAQDYLVKDTEGQVILIPNTSFSAALVDLTNPDARAWMKDVIKTNMIGTGASGWMADFAEAFPFDAAPASGESPATYHNRYPEEWQRLNAEAVAEAGRTGDIVFFSRSGYTRSPGIAPLFWEGDQLVTWDGNDGLRSAIKGLVSGGFSGISLNHTDIGGYTTFGVGPIVVTGRTKELFERWAEMAAFTTVYRTHDGSNPTANWQFYSDADTLAHFARFAKVFAALAPYRRALMGEAAATAKSACSTP